MSIVVILQNFSVFLLFDLAANFDAGGAPSAVSVSSVMSLPSPVGVQW
jgi:hypothetical protein